MSLAIFAALVAAITVVASMTVIGAVGLLFYSAAKQEQEELLIPPNLSGVRHPMPTHLTPPPQSTTYQGQQRLNMIDARHLVGYFEEDEESSLAHFNASQKPLPSPQLPPMQRETPNQENPAFGTPEWTEEEGATEIFSANTPGDLSDFGLVEEEPTRIAATTAAATRGR